MSHCILKAIFFKGDSRSKRREISLRIITACIHRIRNSWHLGYRASFSNHRKISKSVTYNEFTRNLQGMRLHNSVTTNVFISFSKCYSFHSTVCTISLLILCEFSFLAIDSQWSILSVIFKKSISLVNVSNLKGICLI